MKIHPPPFEFLQNNHLNVIDEPTPPVVTDIDTLEGRIC